MMLNCLLVDPDPLVLDLLEKYVGRTPFLQLTGRTQTASEASQYIKTAERESAEGVNLIFWGLEASPINDVELSYILAEWGRGGMKIIFTRKLDESIPYEFKNDIVGQLLSPISYKQLLDTSMKVYEWFIQTEKEPRISRFNLKDNTQKQQNSIWVKDGYRQVNLLFSDILCIERIKEAVRIRLVDGRQVITPMTLKALTEQLPKTEFVRVHRSHIVHMPDVNIIEHGHIIFGQMQIPISNSYRNDFMQMLAQRVSGVVKTEPYTHPNPPVSVGVEITDIPQENTLLD